jgi:AcrR family transcriptional regulator
VPAPSPRTRGPHAQRSAESARRLALAAIELLAERGYHQVSASEIGVRAGYSRELVRAKYGGLEGLLDAVLQQGYEERLGAVPTGLPGLEQVLLRVDRAARLAEDDPVFLRAAFMLSFAGAGGTGHLRGQTQGWWSALHRDLAEALRAGIGDGSVRPGIEVADTASRVAAGAAGFAFTWALDPGWDFAGRMRRWHTELRAELAPPGGRPDTPRAAAPREGDTACES